MKVSETPSADRDLIANLIAEEGGRDLTPQIAQQYIDTLRAAGVDRDPVYILGVLYDCDGRAAYDPDASLGDPAPDGCRPVVAADTVHRELAGLLPWLSRSRIRVYLIYDNEGQVYLDAVE